MSHLIAGNFKQVDEKVSADLGSIRAKCLGKILRSPNPRERKCFRLVEEPAPQVLHFPKSTENLLGGCRLLSITRVDATFTSSEMEV